MKILVVDDNFVNLKVAQGFISPYKADITLASSGFEAIDYIKSGEKYDIIFMDHMMPQMDGIETTQLIREMGTEYTSNVPIIALTANAIKGVEEMFIESGLNDFIAKPLEIKRLGTIMHRWIPKDKQLKSLSSSRNSEPVQDSAKQSDAEIIISGADTEKAARILGSSEALLEILNVIYTDGLKKIPRIRELLEHKDYKNYTIEVHALKSVAAGICADALSEHAKKHEFAGKEGNYAYIDSDAEALLMEYSQLLENILPYVQLPEKAEEGQLAPPLAHRDYIARLEQLITHIDAFEADEAADLIDMLIKTKLPEGDFRKLHDIKNYLDDFMYEEAKACTSEMLYR